MSRVGGAPIPLPKGVKASVRDGVFHAEGRAGRESLPVPREVEVRIDADSVRVLPLGDDKRSRQMWGTARARLARVVSGVDAPFEKRLEIEGVGFRAAVQGDEVVLNLGFSHEVRHRVPEGITVSAPKPTELVVSGTDLQKVGETAARIRAWRPPDPYKAKGVRYAGERIRRKEGKKK